MGTKRTKSDPRVSRRKRQRREEQEKRASGHNDLFVVSPENPIVQRTRSSPNLVPRIPKKTYAILFGYVGEGYHGMQLQLTSDRAEYVRTIEGELAKALRNVGGISEENYGSLQKVKWSRVARTDRGVHAVGQVVALRLLLPLVRREEEENQQLGDAVEEKRREEEENQQLVDAVEEKRREEEEHQQHGTSHQLLPHPLCENSLSTVRREAPLLKNGSETTEAVETKDVVEIEDAVKIEDAVETERVMHNSNSINTSTATRYDELVFAGSLEEQRVKEEAFIERLQHELDELKTNIRIFQMYRVTKSFNAKQLCGKRTYEYLIPIKYLTPVLYNYETVVLHPGYRYYFTMTPDERAQALSAISQEKASENSPSSSIDQENQAAMAHAEEAHPLKANVSPVLTTEDQDSLSDARSRVRNTFFLNSSVDKNEDMNEELQERIVSRMFELLQKYRGNKKFHNFTSRADPRDASLWRFIEDIKAERKQIRGWDMVVIAIKGQSFVLNQIRKMIGLVIEIVRGTAPEWAIEDCLAKYHKRMVHMAPGQGLLLNRVFYESYNSKRASPPATPYLTFEDVATSMEAFKTDVLHTQMVDHYSKDEEQLWRHWIRDIENHPYFIENYPPRQQTLKQSGSMTKCEATRQEQRQENLIDTQ